MPSLPPGRTAHGDDPQGAAALAVFTQPWLDIGSRDMPVAGFGAAEIFAMVGDDGTTKGTLNAGDAHGAWHLGR